MADYGILHQILPEISRDALRNLAALSQIELAQNRAANNLRRLVAMLTPDQAQATFQATSQVTSLAQRLKLSLSERHYLCHVTDLAQNWRQKTQDTGDFYAALRKFGQGVLCDAALIAASRGELVTQEQWHELSNWLPRDLPISGDDVKELGLSEGPDLGKILKNLTRWWESGGCRADRDQCLAQLQQIIKA